MNRKDFINIVIGAVIAIIVIGAIGYFVAIKRPAQFLSIEHQESQNNAPAQPSVNTQSGSKSQAPTEVTKPTGVCDETRSKALDFIKSHSNIYDKAWEWDGFSYQNYTQLPNKEEINYQWFENNESEIIKDEYGNTVVIWTGLPGCKKIGGVYKDESSGTGCYSLLEFAVHFDGNSTPMYIRVMDIGGIE